MCLFLFRRQRTKLRAANHIKQKLLKGNSVLLFIMFLSSGRIVVSSTLYDLKKGLYEKGIFSFCTTMNIERFNEN
jgi:hypothetical protein